MSVLRDRYTGIVLLAFGVALYWFIPDLIKGSKGLGELGPDFFPRVLAIFMIVLSIFQITGTFLTRKVTGNGESTEEKDNNQEVGKRVWASVVVFLIMILHVFVLVEYLNFIISTILAMSVIMWVLSARKWYLYGIVWAFIILIDIIFRNLLYVQLP